MTAPTLVRITHSSRPPMSRAVTRLALRQIRRGTLIVAAVCAGMSTLVAAQYQSTFRDELSQDALRALAENPAIRVLFGAPVALDDPGGFTVWRTGIPVLVLAGTWIMLAAIRITRAEEDAGRWDLMLSGPLRTTDAVRCCLVALAGSAAVIGIGVGVGLIAAGTDIWGAICYAAGVFGVTLTFAAVGLVAAQAMPSRSAAVGLAVAYLGAALLLRMLADGIAALAWTAWLTPLGLIARVAPYAENRIAPLLVLPGYAAVLAAAALTAARHRDLGTGLLRMSTHRAPRTRLLGCAGGFAVRRGLRPTIGWAVGVGAYFVLIGAMIASILDFFDQNPRFAELAAAAGFSGLDSADGFAAALFSLLAIPTGLYCATRLGAFVSDERARRWTPVLASPVPRTHLLRGEILMTAGGLVALHATAAAAMWVGATLTGAPLGFTDALAGALNTAPIAALALGAATLAVGRLPASVSAVGAVPVVGGFLVNVLAESVRAPAWVRDLSPFVHVPAVPSTTPDWPSTVGLLAVGATLAAIGVAGYGRRDLMS